VEEGAIQRTVKARSYGVKSGPGFVGLRETNFTKNQTTKPAKGILEIKVICKPNWCISIAIYIQQEINMIIETIVNVFL
jgi:hypothetical protein